MHYIVVDIGSNTVRLVIYEMVEGRLIPVFNQKEFLGLLNYIKKGRLTLEGMTRLSAILHQFSMIGKVFQVEKAFYFATEALRSASNLPEVLEFIQRNNQLEIQMISGKQEAYFEYLGLIYSLKKHPPGILIGAGGGSTQITVFQGPHDFLYSESLPIGSLRYYKKHIAGVLPTSKEYHHMLRQADSVISSSLPSLETSYKTVYAIGGTARNVAKLYQSVYDLDQPLQKMKMDVKKLEQLYFHIQQNKIKGLKLMSKVCAERVFTLFPGLAILLSGAKFFGAKKLQLCKYGVREGYLLYTLWQSGKLSLPQHLCLK